MHYLPQLPIRKQENRHIFSFHAVRGGAGFDEETNTGLHLVDEVGEMCLNTKQNRP